MIIERQLLLKIGVLCDESSSLNHTCMYSTSADKHNYVIYCMCILDVITKSMAMVSFISNSNSDIDMKKEKNKSNSK